MIKRLFIFACLLALAAGCSTPGPLPNNDPQPTVETPAAVIASETPTSVPATATIPAAPEVTATAEVSPTPAAYGPTGFPANVNPLTGVEVSDPQVLNRRPVAVKIQMYPRGQRPPWGISLADIVFDYVQNFGMTRFHAIFYGQDAEMVGPIRSARLLDIDLINSYQSIFVYGGAEQRTSTALFSQEFYPRLVLEGTVPCPPMCRIDPNMDNFLVANTKELSVQIAAKGSDNARQPLEGMRFDSVIPAGGQAGMQATVRHSISAYARWDFDAASGRYLRSQDAQEASDVASEAYTPLVDRQNNAQIAADNVVIIVVGHRYTFNSKPGPNEVLEIGLQGTGPAFAFRDGQVFQLTWKREKRDDVISLAFEDGTPFPYKPGNTWFEVVGKSSETLTDGAAWRFNHLMP